jgi:hypothetical protein
VFEKLIFKRIELWAVLLIFLFMVVGSWIFSAIALYSQMGGRRLDPMGVIFYSAAMMGIYKEVLLNLLILMRR